MLDFVLPTEKDRDSVLDFYDEIEKNGGVLENTLFDPYDKTVVKRYWITLGLQNERKEE